MFRTNSTRRDVIRAIVKTVESPDRTFKQRDGRLVGIKTFSKPVGEKPYFDERRILRRRYLYKVRVLYINRGRGKVIITAYPVLWRTLNDRSCTWSYMGGIIIMLMETAVNVTMIMLNVILCLPLLAFRLLSWFVAPASTINFFHDFRYHLWYYYL